MDFIETYAGAVDPDICAEIVQRLCAAPDAMRDGVVGGGVHPELKRSRDLLITHNDDWADIEGLLQQAVLVGLLRYLRKYPQVLLSPLMLEADFAAGRRRLLPEDLIAMDDALLTAYAQACLRPGKINLQWYAADTGGYPYWHCELFPRDPSCESLHRHLLWTIYLNDEFDAGETEFLFQNRKIKPRTGALLIAPAAFTHTHRGNTPFGADKCIATSWILFERAERLFGSSGMPVTSGG